MSARERNAHAVPSPPTAIATNAAAACAPRHRGGARSWASPFRQALGRAYFLGSTMSSTRRLAARPSIEVLSAAGLSGPLPSARTRS